MEGTLYPIYLGRRFECLLGILRAARLITERLFLLSLHPNADGVKILSYPQEKYTDCGPLGFHPSKVGMELSVLIVYFCAGRNRSF